jgi:shikimate kinase
MKTHLLLIGFSCTGKTYLGEKAFGKDSVIDSDDEVRKWIGNKEEKHFDHVYEIYTSLGRKRALTLIEEAENALIDRWADDTCRKVICLGPGFPLRGKNWGRLRANAHVVLLRKSPHGIYERMKKRREEIFKCCPNAKEHDNWDVGVIVDEDRKEFSKEIAVSKIQQLLNDREIYYRDHDAEIDTDNDNALQKLKQLKSSFWSGSPTGKRS